MGKTNFDIVQANSFIGIGMTEASPFASIFYVDGSNGNDSNSGTAPDAAFKTIAAAIAVTSSGRGDQIIIAPGTYTLTTVLTPKAGNIFKAAIVNAKTPSVVITGSIAILMGIDVSYVKCIGIKFYAAADACATLVEISETANVNGPEFYFCLFDGQDKASCDGILANDATYGPTGLIVKWCTFKNFTGTPLNVGVIGIPFAEIQFNTFSLDVNSGTAIALADTGAFAVGKGFVIADNVFIGFDATASEAAITIAGTESTTGAGIITRNMFAWYAAAAITADKIAQSIINNYVGDMGTGGTLVDSGTP